VTGEKLNIASKSCLKHEWSMEEVTFIGNRLVLPSISTRRFRKASSVPVWVGEAKRKIIIEAPS